MLDKLKSAFKNGQPSGGEASKAIFDVFKRLRSVVTQLLTFVSSRLKQADITSRKGLFRLGMLSALVIVGGGTWTFFLRPIKVEVSRAARDVPVQVFGLGTTEARVTSKIGFKVSGVLVDLRADVGDRVAKGTVLARLDDREQKARVSRAKAAIEQAEANLQKTTAGIEKAQANLANAKNINERRQKLLLSNTVSVETAETSKTAQDAAVADVNLALSDAEVARAQRHRGHSASIVWFDIPSTQTGRLGRTHPIVRPRECVHRFIDQSGALGQCDWCASRTLRRGFFDRSNDISGFRRGHLASSAQSHSCEEGALICPSGKARQLQTDNFKDAAWTMYAMGQKRK
jgi:multidrug efflux pump subunit AcrA (membrane-fusion protein)